MTYKECKRCNVEKAKIRSHKISNGDRYKQWAYKDDKGCFWSGRLCPECAAQDRLERRNRDKEIDDDLPPVLRLCRKCQRPLPAARYFNHQNCSVQYEYLDLSERYETHF